MTDGNPTAAPILLGQIADQMDVHRLGRVADIEVDINIDVEFTREFKDSPDLAGMVGVISWRAADRLGPALQRLDQQLIGPRVIGKPVLGKGADLDIDCPFIVCNYGLYALESAQADSGVDFDLGAHPRRTVKDALNEGVLGSGAHILDGKPVL